MKRIGVRVLLFLLIGAVINVAVAWVCAARPRGLNTTTSLAGQAAAKKGWGVPAAASWGPPNGWEEFDRFGHTTFYISSNGGIEQGYHLNTGVNVDRAGWPLRSLQSTRLYPPDGLDTERWSEWRFHFHSWRIGIVKSPPSIAGGISLSYLPAQPLWLGFLIDSVAYGGLAALALLAPPAARRHIRTRAGLCPACAYPVGVSPVCTECGRPVKAKAATA